MIARPLLQVLIVDDLLSGRVLADVDAVSTADALAFFLRSRGIVPDATESSIRMGAFQRGRGVGNRAPMLAEGHDPETGELAWAYIARVKKEGK